MNLTTKIASNQTETWWCHDSKDYHGVEFNVRQMLNLLGYTDDLSKAASRFIGKSYIFYDKAEEHQEKKNYYFKKVEECHFKTLQILGGNTKLAKLYKDWWEYFLKRNYPSTAYYLIIYHVAGFKGIKKIFSPIACVLFILAGFFGHNKRKKETNIFFLSLYWKLITSLKIKNFVTY